MYTINTVLADKDVAVPSNFAYLAGAEKIDENHVRVKLKRIFPAALEYMSMTLPIWPKAYRERVGAEAYSRAPVGTGPYKITKVDGRVRNRHGPQRRLLRRAERAIPPSPIS